MQHGIVSLRKETLDQLNTLKKRSIWWSANDAPEQIHPTEPERKDSAIIQNVSVLVRGGAKDTSEKIILALHKKWSFPLRISSVNVTKSAGNCGFGHIYWRNPYWKTSFFVQRNI